MIQDFTTLCIVLALNPVTTQKTAPFWYDHSASWSASLSQTLPSQAEIEHPYLTPSCCQESGLPDGHYTQFVWGRQAVGPWYVGLRCCALPSPPIKAAIIISPPAAMGVQPWEPRTFLKTFLSVVNYWKQLQVSSWHPRRQLDIFERHFFFHDPWRWLGLTRRKAGNAEIPHVRDWHKPCMSLWILHFLVMCLCSETSTFLTFNHWTKSSTKVLVEKWNETKYLESTFKETKGIGGIWLETHYMDHWHKSNQFRLIFITQCQLLWKSCRKI